MVVFLLLTLILTLYFARFFVCVASHASSATQSGVVLAVEVDTVADALYKYYYDGDLRDGCVSVCLCGVDRESAAWQAARRQHSAFRSDKGNDDVVQMRGVSRCGGGGGSTRTVLQLG